MDQLASGNALICGKYQYANGLMGRLGVDIPPVLDTVDASCLHNFILNRPVLSIVHDNLALEQGFLYILLSFCTFSRMVIAMASSSAMVMTYSGITQQRA